MYQDMNLSYYQLDQFFVDFPSSKYHNAKAAPSDPPASPAAGCIHILSKIFFSRILPLATQFNATPPAKHKFLIPNSFDRIC